MHPFDNHEVLLEALQKGEEKAFVYLFDRYYEGLLNYAGRIVRETELAHDLVQETFCKLYEDHVNLSIHLSVKSYLYKSVYNSCLNEIKHQKVVNNYADRELLDFYFTEIVQAPEAPQRGSDQTAASLNGVLRRSGSEEILQGSKNGCVLIRKKKFMVWALVGTGGPAPCRWALPDR